jgi:hypothetical protein
VVGGGAEAVHQQDRRPLGARWRRPQRMHGMAAVAPGLNRATTGGRRGGLRQLRFSRPRPGC